MDARKLNAEIKKLGKDWRKFQSLVRQGGRNENGDRWVASKRLDFVTMVQLLYGFDRNFDLMNKASMVVLTSMNCELKAIPLEEFCKIDLIRMDGDFKTIEK